jgi:hypothetical protein
MTEAPSGRAAVSATDRVAAFLPPDVLVLVLGEGSIVGNRPPALPPGVRVGLGAETSGRLPMGSGDVVAAGMMAPVMAMVAVASGSFFKWAALPMTVSVTDRMVDVAVTVACACSWRSADRASIAPRSQDGVPSLLPQPKLNCGVTLAGEACSRMVASGMFPPVVQAVTTH